MTDSRAVDLSHELRASIWQMRFSEYVGNACLDLKQKYGCLLPCLNCRRGDGIGIRNHAALRHVVEQ